MKMHKPKEEGDLCIGYQIESLTHLGFTETHIYSTNLRRVTISSLGLYLWLFVNSTLKWGKF